MNIIVIQIIGISLVLGFLLNLFFTPLLIHLSHRHELYDEINERKVHTENTSRLGGIGIFISFSVSSFLSPFLVRFVVQKDIFFLSGDYTSFFLFSSIVVIFITGVLDDFSQIRARYKLLGQILAAVLAVAGGAMIHRLQIPFTGFVLELGYFSIPLSIFWLVGISNALNLIDGIDGLSSGISIIATMTFGFLFLLSGHFLPAIICYALIGALFGYLFFNFPPATIFMGDSGSLFLGFILALLPITAFPESSTSLVAPVTVLAIPILDVVAAVWRRAREGRDIFSPDRFHVHHKMMNLGLDNRQILAIIYGIVFLLGISVIVFESAGAGNFLFLLPSWIIAIAFFLYLHYKKK